MNFHNLRGCALSWLTVKKLIILPPPSHPPPEKNKTPQDKLCSSVTSTNPQDTVCSVTFISSFHAHLSGLCSMQSSLLVLKLVQAGISRLRVLKGSLQCIRLPITAHISEKIKAFVAALSDPDKHVIWAIAASGFFLFPPRGTTPSGLIPPN